MTQQYTQNAIVWPHKYLPGTTDNFVSNEIYIQGVTALDVWRLLADISKWESYYANCEQITPPGSGTYLAKGDHFKFSTFGFPVLPAVVEESHEPTKDQPGRIAWSAKLEGSDDERVDVYHAWLVEDVSENRVRVLTQEAQIGRPGAELASKKPNKMLLGHQDWLEGLMRAAKGEKTKDNTNLEAI